MKNIPLEIPGPEGGLKLWPGSDAIFQLHHQHLVHSLIPMNTKIVEFFANAAMECIILRLASIPLKMIIPKSISGLSGS